MLKEQVARYIAQIKGLDWEWKSTQINCVIEADQIHNLYKARFKEIVDKLTVMADAEVKVILEKGFDINFKPESQEHIQRIIQLQHTKNELDLMEGSNGN